MQHYVATLFTIAKVRKYCSVANKWIKKLCVLFPKSTTHYKTLIIKHGILPFVTTWMGLKDIILSEVRKKKCAIIKKCFDKWKKQNTNTENRLVIRGKEEEIGQENYMMIYIHFDEHSVAYKDDKLQYYVPEAYVMLPQF